MVCEWKLQPDYSLEALNAGVKIGKHACIPSIVESSAGVLFEIWHTGPQRRRPNAGEYLLVENAII